MEGTEPPMPPMGPEPLARPPADADEWTDQQWLDWLVATDIEATEPESRSPGPGRITGSRGGQALGNAMLGIANALYGPRKPEVVIIHEASGEPDEDEPFEVRLDPDHPERSEVVIRHDLRRRARDAESRDAESRDAESRDAVSRAPEPPSGGDPRAP